MAAPRLRRYGAALTGTAATTIVAAVPTNRALVGKVIVAASGAGNLTLTAGGVNLITASALAAGDVYTETNVVLQATETLTATSSVANVMQVTFMGEEVDN